MVHGGVAFCGGEASSGGEGPSPSGSAVDLLRGFEGLDARREDEVVDGRRDRRTGELRADVEGRLLGGCLVARDERTGDRRIEVRAWWRAQLRWQACATAVAGV